MAELVGYVGSVLVLVSLTMSNIWRLRWINLVGAAFFVVYGLAVRAYPVALVNAIIVAVDAYYLGMLAARKDYFGILPVSGPGEALLKEFLDFHRDDISRFFPGFELHRVAQPRCVFTLRNLMPVGLFVYEAQGQAVRIHLDYVTPEYRDLKNARYLYSSQAGRLRQEGFSEFLVKAESEAFEGYVRQLGFEPKVGEPGTYTRKI